MRSAPYLRQTNLLSFIQHGNGHLLYTAINNTNELKYCCYTVNAMEAIEATQKVVRRLNPK